jgi:hypothetical protein
MRDQGAVQTGSFESIPYCYTATDRLQAVSLICNNMYSLHAYSAAPDMQSMQNSSHD